MNYIRTFKPILFCVLLLQIAAGTRLSAGEDRDRTSGPYSLFYQANALYQESRYEEAAALYRELVDNGYESGNLYFNLGNTYYKLGRTGLAVLYYEKARRLIPRDADLLANLNYVLEGVEEGIPDWKSEFFRNLVTYLPAEQVVVLASCCFFLFTALVIAGLLFPEKIRAGYRSLWLVFCSVSGFFFLFFLTLSGLQYYDRLTPAGVAVGDGLVRYEPADHATVHFTLAEGSRVKIAGEKDNWYLITRRDGKRGWVEKLYIEKI